jgi:hypothetical protein
VEGVMSNHQSLLRLCGSLSHNRYDNNVSRILRNVLDRFRARR